MKYLLILICLLVVSCVSTPQPQIFTLPNSPQLLDPAICSRYPTPIKRIGCYDTISKYNQDESICDLIEQANSSDFVQTAQNCKLQLQESQLYVKGIISNGTPLQDLSLLDLRYNESVIDLALPLLKARYDCPKASLCTAYPDINQESYYTVCFCFAP